jgi:putative glutathione S-transferase
MGRLLDGQWINQDLGTDAQGRYVRQETQFRRKFDDDECSAADIAEQRYLLLVGSPCGWSHRVLLVRALMGFESSIPVVFTDAYMGEDGWTFFGHNSNEPKVETKGGITAQELYADPGIAGYDPTQIVAQKLHQVYVLAKNDYTGRCLVPVLWDRRTGTVVNNESSDLIMMLAQQAPKESSSSSTPITIDLMPVGSTKSIREMMDANYMPINNGVYRCGFASAQEAYTEAATTLFQRLDELEQLLARQRYLCSNEKVTMADICLFPTLYRFDMVYYTHFKCNRKHIYEYPNLWGWTREIYQLPGVAATCKMEECCIHYYTSHETIHPRRYIPLGPIIDFDEPHGRDKMDL